MAFTLPNFNLLADRWVSPNTPAAGAPDFLAIPCQLYVNSRGLLDITPGDFTAWVPPIYIRLQVGAIPPVKDDIYEVIPGSADYYKVRWTQSIHKGFPNEYIVVLVEQCDAAGTTPRP